MNCDVSAIQMLVNTNTGNAINDWIQDPATIHAGGGSERTECCDGGEEERGRRWVLPRKSVVTVLSLRTCGLDDDITGIITLKAVRG